MFFFLLRYVAFDFHKECSQMRWDRLQILVDNVSEIQDEFGCVEVLPAGSKAAQPPTNDTACLHLQHALLSFLTRRLKRVPRGQSPANDLHPATLPWCPATSWWTLRAWCSYSRRARFAVTAWTAWTVPTSSRACWHAAHCSRSCRWGGGASDHTPIQ